MIQLNPRRPISPLVQTLGGMVDKLFLILGLLLLLFLFLARVYIVTVDCVPNVLNW